MNRSACMSLVDLGQRTLNLYSLDLFSFLLSGSQMWQQSSFDLVDEYSDLVGTEQQDARNLYTWMILWSNVSIQAKSRMTIPCFLSWTKSLLNKFSAVSPILPLLLPSKGWTSSTALSIPNNLHCPWNKVYDQGCNWSPSLILKGSIGYSELWLIPSIYSLPLHIYSFPFFVLKYNSSYLFDEIGVILQNSA